MESGGRYAVSYLFGIELTTPSRAVHRTLRLGSDRRKWLRFISAHASLPNIVLPL